LMVEQCTVSITSPSVPSYSLPLMHLAVLVFILCFLHPYRSSIPVTDRFHSSLVIV